MTFKDWVTITLSVLAFIISASTAYINLIRQDDDLRMVVQGDLRFRSEPHSDVEPAIGLYSEDQRITFINLGNRDASITALSLGVKVFDTDTGARTCEGGSGWQLAYDIEPFTVKGGESVTKTLQFAPR